MKYFSFSKFTREIPFNRQVNPKQISIFDAYEYILLVFCISFFLSFIFLLLWLFVLHKLCMCFFLFVYMENLVKSDVTASRMERLPAVRFKYKQFPMRLTQFYYSNQKTRRFIRFSSNWVCKCLKKSTNK